MSLSDKVFLFYIYVLLPWISFSSIRKIRKSGKPVKLGEKRQLGTMFMHAWVLALAVFTARDNGIVFAFFPVDNTRAVLWAMFALVPCTAWLIYRSRAVVPTDAIVPPQALAPHGRTRWTLWICTSVSAGIVEEFVWRGVGTAILATYVGLVPGAIISAVGFGAMHALQGKRVIVISGLFGLMAQALIAVTGALLPAMVVHSVYDIAAGYVLSKRFPAQGVTVIPD